MSLWLSCSLTLLEPQRPNSACYKGGSDDRENGAYRKPDWMRNHDQLGDGRGQSIKAKSTIGAVMPSSAAAILRIIDRASYAKGCWLARTGFINFKSSMLEKIQYLPDDQFASHDERMTVRHDQEVRHSFELGPLNRNLAIVLAWNHHGHEKIDAAVAGNDPHVESGWAKLRWQVILVRTQLLSCRAMDGPETRHAGKFIHDLAALIRGAEHDDPPQIVEHVRLKIIANQNPSHGMGDEVNMTIALFIAAFDGCRDHFRRKFIDGFLS